MGLFSKKSCSVCGGEIGLFGNRKLEDGNLCKDCAAKLSPFFRERRASTVAEIEAQLAYREANKADVAAFHVTRSLGGSTKVLLDEDDQKFIVTSKTRWAEENPDVMRFSDVTGCTYRIDEDKRKIEREEETQPAVATRPAQPQASANMRNMAGAPAAAGSVAQRYANQRAPQAPPAHQSSFAQRASMAGAAPQGRPAPPARPMNQGFVAAAAPAGYAAATASTEPEYEYSYDFEMTINVNNPYFDTITFQVNDEHIDSTESVEYANMVNICEEIKGTLLGVRADARAAAAAAAAPKTALTCPHCGATCIPDDNGRCEYCGGAML